MSETPDGDRVAAAANPSTPDLTLATTTTTSSTSASSSSSISSPFFDSRIPSSSPITNTKKSLLTKIAETKSKQKTIVGSPQYSWATINSFYKQAFDSYPEGNDPPTKAGLASKRYYEHILVLFDSEPEAIRSLANLGPFTGAKLKVRRDIGFYDGFYGLF